MKLYKYRSINSFTSDIIQNSRLYFPTIECLNDPHEIVHPIEICLNVFDPIRHRFLDKLDIETKVSHVTKAGEIARERVQYNAGNPMLRFGLGPPQAERPERDADEELFNELEVHEALTLYVGMKVEDVLYGKELLANATQKIKNKLCGLGVLSLTSKNDCQLMFAHYAANHQGIVLEFDTEKDVELARARKVKYYLQRPKITMENICDIIYIKAADWSYEHEYRLIQKSGSKAYQFNSKALSGVIFGYRTNSESRKLIQAWLDKAALSVNFYQAEPDPDTFSLKIHAL
jgi:hypothetical protein